MGRKKNEMETRGNSEKGGRKGKTGMDISYGRIRIGGQWWKWDEVGEVLRNGRGRIRWEEQGKEGEREAEGLG